MSGPNRFLSRSLPAVVLAFALTLSACGDDASNAGDQGETPGNQTDGTVSLNSGDVVLTGALNTFANCDELLTQLKAEGIERVGPYGFEANFMGPVARLGEEGDDAADGGAAPSMDTTESTEDAGGAARDGNFSTTNVQEAGVDEADLVKTDGKRLVTASNGYLNVMDLATNSLERSIELPENSWNGELFLVDEMALIVSSGWRETPLTEASRDMWYPGSPITTIEEIDLNTGEATRTITFEGNYLSAREIDGSVRIVVTAPADRFNFLYPSNEGANEQAEKANKAAIEESTIEQWIPSYRLTEGDTVVDEGLIANCDRVHLPSEFAGFGSMVVLTADAEKGLELTDSMSVFTNASMMYASTDRLVIGTPKAPQINWETGEFLPDENYRTALHSFDITNPNRTDYIASGSVEGHLLSNYSMSEYNGYLRVAATVGSPWNPEGQQSSESFVTVLAEQGSSLEKVGQVGDLGKGETIFAVRFMGDTGYVVTFRQTDPLYVIDLEDPTDPKTVGELKIPGFSSYLHPIREGRMLGIGTDGDEEGRTSGAVASLFDVSDPTNPQRIDKLALGANFTFDQGDSYSEVANDPRAFTQWEDTAFVPVTWWGWSEADDNEENGSAVELIDISTDTLARTGSVSAPVTEQCERDVYLAEEAEEAEAVEIEPETTIAEESQGDAEAEFVTTTVAETSPPVQEYCWTMQPNLNRTVIVDDNLYAVGREGILVTNLDDLTGSQWIQFPTRP